VEGQWLPKTTRRYAVSGRIWERCQDEEHSDLDLSFESIDTDMAIDGLLESRTVYSSFHGWTQAAVD
jgi:hypothetical protein